MAVKEKPEKHESDEKIVEIELERLRTFQNHPFKVQADSQMIELQDSIKKYGILNPLIVRPRPDAMYEIISGHRRRFAAEQLGYRKVPVIIRVLQDDEAVISMVDSNLQRERISPSEKAFAYKMKYDVIKRKTGRRKCGQIDHHSGKKSIEIIGAESGESPKQVQRYIKMTDLIPELLEKVDDGTMGFTPAVQISYLKKKDQEKMLEAMDYSQCTPSLQKYIRITELIPELVEYVDMKKIAIAMAVDISYFDEQVQKWVYEYLKDNGFLKPVQVAALKEEKNLSKATQYDVISTLNAALPTKVESAKVSLSEKKLDKYFPSHYSSKERENIIIQLLEQWSESQEQ